LPATLALLSGTFHGRERATAFAAWGATAGVAAACGPVVGGFLTTNYSWRWSFRINVIIAPIAIIGAILFMKDSVSSRRRAKLDFLGAALVAAGMFLFVFALSEGGTYGWLTPVENFTIAGRVLWPATRSVSIMPIVFVMALVILVLFYGVERSKERRNAGPLFEFAHLRLKSYRYGLLTGLVLAMGQLGLSFVLPVFLQNGKHLSAARNGLWLLPTGLFVIVGAQLGGRLIRRFGATVVVRMGLVLYAIGVALVLRSIDLDLTVWGLLPGLACYGAGIGFAGAQLTNVVLSEIPNESSGVASGANTTVRQVGSALGVAVIGSLLSAQTISHSVRAIKSAALPAGVKVNALAGVHALGSNYVPPASVSPRDTTLITSALEHGVATGTRYALSFAIVVVAAGALLSFLIPRAAAQPGERSYRDADVFEPLEPLDPDPALVAEVAATS
jgi:MFS family permease